MLLTADDIRAGTRPNEGDELTFEAVELLNSYTPLVIAKDRSDSIHFFSGQLPYSFVGEIIKVPEYLADGWGRLIKVAGLTIDKISKWYEYSPIITNAVGGIETYTAATTGNYRADNADTWGRDIGVYPTSIDDVVIDAAYTVTLVEENSCASFTMSNGMIAGSTLNCDSITTTGGTFSNITLNCSGSVDLTGCTLNGNVYLTMTGTGNLMQMQVLVH